MKNVTCRKRTSKSGSYTWEYRFDGASVDGKRKQITKGGYKTKKAAMDAGAHARNRYYSSGQAGLVSVKMTVADFVLNEWFPAQREKSRWQETTEQGYAKRIRNYILPFIGGMQITCVPAAEIQKMLNLLYYGEKHICHRTVSDVHSLLVNIFQFARAQRYIAESPMTYVTIPKMLESETDAGCADTRQVRDAIPPDVLAGIFDRFPVGTAPFLPMMIALKTGMRLGEVFGLCWEDIDFIDCVISINRQMQDATDTYTCNPKYNSKREVPISTDLFEILLNEKERQEQNRKKYGKLYQRTFLTRRTDSASISHNVCDIHYGAGGTEVHFVNVRPDGTVISPRIMQHASRIIHGYSASKNDKGKKSVNDAEHPYVFEDFNFHSLRHTFATELRRKGFNEVIIGSLLGHSGSSYRAANVTYEYIHATNRDFLDIGNAISTI